MLQPKAILGGGNLPKVTETAAFLIPHTAPFCSAQPCNLLVIIWKTSAHVPSKQAINTRRQKNRTMARILSRNMKCCIDIYMPDTVTISIVTLPLIYAEAWGGVWL